MAWNFPLVINGGGIHSIRTGPKEAMEQLIPTPSTKGRIFLVTTPGEEVMYLDNGTEWVPINNCDNSELFEEISLLQDALQQEVERAKSEEENLEKKLSVLTTEISTLTTEANIIIISLNNEIIRSQQSEEKLKEMMEMEIQRAQMAEKALEQEIEEQRLEIQDEAERAKEAEEGLRKFIATEGEKMAEIKNSLENEMDQLQETLNHMHAKTMELIEALKNQIVYIQSIRQFGYFTTGSNDQHIGQMGQEAVSFHGPSLSSEGIELMSTKTELVVIRNEGIYRFSFIVGVKSVGSALFGLVDENNSVLYTAGTFGTSSLGVNYTPLVGEVILRIPEGGSVIQLKNINDHITTIIGSVPDINSSTPNTHSATLLIERIN